MSPSICSKKGCSLSRRGTIPHRKRFPQRWQTCTLTAKQEFPSKKGINEVSTSDKTKHQLKWPQISSQPINEFNYHGYIVQAFPVLLPFGFGDYLNVKNKQITASVYFQYLMQKIDRRFSKHKLFPYFALNSIWRWEALSLGTVYMKKKPELKDLIIEHLKDLVSESISIPKSIMVYSSSIRGSKSYWMSRTCELEAMVDHFNLPTLFFSLSAADHHWPRQFEILLGDSDVDVDLTETRRRNLLVDNADLCSDYFYETVSIFIIEVLVPFLKVLEYWFRFEWQMRGHVHGVLWVHGAPKIVNFETMSETEKVQVIDYFSALVKAWNPHCNYVITTNHPCRLKVSEVQDKNEDTAALVNTQKEVTEDFWRQNALLNIPWRNIDELLVEDNWEASCSAHSVTMDMFPYVIYTKTDEKHDDAEYEDGNDYEHITKDDWMNICNLSGSSNTELDDILGQRSIDLSYPWSSNVCDDTFFEIFQNFITYAKKKHNAFSKAKRPIPSCNNDQCNVLNLLKRQINMFKIVSTQNTHLPHLCVCEGFAGTGKSILLQAMVELVDTELGDGSSWVMAPTGSSTLHVNGPTIHSAIRLNWADIGNVPDLKGETLFKWREKFSTVKFVFIEEYSMVGCKLMYDIHKRLCHLTEKTVPFGGLFVWFIGNIRQLPPVGDTPWYKEDVQGAKAQVVAGSLLHKEIWFFSLHPNFDKLIKIFFNAWEISVVARKKDVAFQNLLKLKMENKPVLCIEAESSSRYAKACSRDQAMGLSNVLYLSLGSRVILKKNLCVDAGLVNGALGLTLPKVVFHVKGKELAAGEFYVALSRVKALEDLIIIYDGAINDCPLFNINSTIYEERIRAEEELKLKASTSEPSPSEPSTSSNKGGEEAVSDSEKRPLKRSRKANSTSSRRRKGKSSGPDQSDNSSSAVSSSTESNPPSFGTQKPDSTSPTNGNDNNTGTNTTGDFRSRFNERNTRVIPLRHSSELIVGQLYQIINVQRVNTKFGSAISDEYAGGGFAVWSEDEKGEVSG
ncbi:ATP-dependent DNA helicase [Frankliniella fusca]|uniref:ATP-dependent DNA helicase n=1 Tax=Frankliniella fusca TaxID=407009 RepID=A0AAE1H7P4_9NEOP|nr:ATP-dependent DNA helicase [Frankliniella fusca]